MQVDSSSKVTELLYDPAIPLLGAHTQKSWKLVSIQKTVCITVLFIIVKKVETTQCPATDDQINKRWSVHTSGILSSTDPATEQMNFEKTMVNQGS